MSTTWFGVAGTRPHDLDDYPAVRRAGQPDGAAFSLRSDRYRLWLDAVVGDESGGVGGGDAGGGDGFARVDPGGHV